MNNISLDSIRSFLAVAEYGSFSAAALHLAVTPTAISKAVKALERQHGVLLFQRTTRSVALTEAGASLYAHLAPATAQIDDAFTALTLFRDRPAGTLRLSVPRAFGAIVMARVVPAFRRDFPDVALDLTLDDGAVDLVQQGFDAGIRLGQSVEQDMVAVRRYRRHAGRQRHRCAGRVRPRRPGAGLPGRYRNRGRPGQRQAGTGAATIHATHQRPVPVFRGARAEPAEAARVHRHGRRLHGA